MSSILIPVCSFNPFGVIAVVGFCDKQKQPISAAFDFVLFARRRRKNNARPQPYCMFPGTYCAGTRKDIFRFSLALMAVLCHCCVWRDAHELDFAGLARIVVYFEQYFSEIAVPCVLPLKFLRFYPAHSKSQLLCCNCRATMQTLRFAWRRKSIAFATLLLFPLVKALLLRGLAKPCFARGLFFLRKGLQGGGFEPPKALSHQISHNLSWFFSDCRAICFFGTAFFSKERRLESGAFDRFATPALKDFNRKKE